MSPLRCGPSSGEAVTYCRRCNNNMGTEFGVPHAQQTTEITMILWDQIKGPLDSSDLKALLEFSSSVSCSKQGQHHLQQVDQLFIQFGLGKSRMATTQLLWALLHCLRVYSRLGHPDRKSMRTSSRVAHPDEMSSLGSLSCTLVI